MAANKVTAGVNAPFGAASGASPLKLADKEAFLALASTKPIGDASVDSTLLEAKLSPNLSLSPFSTLSLNLRGAISVQVLNGPEDTDKDGIAAAVHAAGEGLAPQ